MDKPQDKLIRGSFYLMLDNASNMILGALFWIIMAKIVEPEILGKAMVAVAFATSIIGFTGYGTSVMISKHVAEFNAKELKHNSRKILSIGLRLALIVSSIAALAIVLLSSSIAENIYKDPSIGIFLIVSAIGFIPSQTIQVSLKGAFEGSQRMDYSLLITIIFQSLRLTSAIALVLLGLSGLGIIAGFAAGTSIASIIGYYLIQRIIPKVKGKYDDLKYTIRFSVYNYLNAGMRTLAMQIGIITLGAQNFEFAAFYGLASIISTIVGGLFFAISRAMLPTVSERYAFNDYDRITSIFNSSVRMALVLSGFVFIILFLQPSYVLSLLSESYTEASDALRILVIATMINSLSGIGITIINASGNARAVANIGLISYSISIVLTIILANTLGLIGAAFAMLIGSLLMISLTSYTLKVQGLSLHIRSISKPILSLVTTIAIGLLLLPSIINNIIILLGVVILLHASLSLAYKATNKSEILNIISSLSIKR